MTSLDSTPIIHHEGKKYIRRIVGCTPFAGAVTISDGRILPIIEIDVYAVINAFKIICPAQQHALKKILAAGERDKGSSQDDFKGALAAINRAIEMDQISDDLSGAINKEK